MPADVKDYVAKCLLCARMAAMPKAPSLSYVLERPFPMQLVSLDHVGPRNWKGSQFHYLVMIDHHSRFLQACVVASVTSTETKKAFHEKWIGVFGVPDVVLTDRGPAFRAEDFRNYTTQVLGAYHVFTSPYYPRGNGINEACHASLEACMKAFANGEDDYAFEEENEVFELAGRPTDSILRVNSQDSEESEDTYKGKFPRIFDVSFF